MLRTNQEKEETICKLYGKNVLINDIALQTGISRNTVIRVLQRHNLYNHTAIKRLGKERVLRNQQIAILSSQGLSTRQIATQLHMGKSTVQAILSNKQKFNQTLDFQERFFQTIDTEEKAYWLGFLYADGCITDKSVRMELTLSDQFHLEKLRNTINYYRSQFYYRNDNVKSVLYTINSTAMVQDLSNLGCTARKSLSIRFPTSEQVPDTLIHHFMRGYFDGNGCINIATDTRSAINIVSNMYFLEGYQHRLNIGIHKTTNVKIQQTKSYGIGLLTLGGNRQVLKIYDFLYNGATIFLDRKYNKFQQLISRFRSTTQKEI